MSAFAKVTIGRDLNAIRERQDELHRILPAHTAAVESMVSVDGWQVLFQTALSGPSLEELLGSVDTLPRALIAYRILQNALDTTLQSANHHEWEWEWQIWKSRFSALPCWDSSEQRTLVELLQRDLEPRLCHEASALSSRWTNGDFTSENIIVPESGNPWLIDAENGQRTHFWFEDDCRLSLLSPTLRNHPGLRGEFAKDFTSPQFLFFQLRQLWLEHEQNSSDYLARVVPTRKQLILGKMPPHPSPRVAGVPWVDPEIETAQLFWGQDRNSTEAQSGRRFYRRGQPQLMAWKLENQASHFRLDPTSSQRPVLIRNLISSDAHGKSIDLIAETTTRANCSISASPAGLLVMPESNDPQLNVSLPERAEWVIADLEVKADSALFSQSNPAPL